MTDKPAEPDTTAGREADEIRAKGVMWAADEICWLRETLREIRRDIIETADDTVWMRGGIETVVDRINSVIGTEGGEL